MNDETNPESTALLSRFRELPGPVQRLIIGVLFLTLLVGVVVLKNLVNTQRSTQSDEAIEV